ncbi:MAG: OmpA family protein [Crocinitomicaceae bacterium]|nr:OmpA family protein [Crocinitomicaceae bacterium]
MLKRYLVILVVLLTGGLYAQNVEFEKANFPDDKDGLKEAKSQLKQGNELFEEGPMFYKDAIPFFEAANEFNPNNADLNFRLGDCYLSSMFKYKALPFLEKALKLNPKIDSKIHYLLGMAYHLDMQWDRAITEYSKYRAAVQSDPNNARNPYFDLQGVMAELKLAIDQCYNGREIVKTPIRVFVDNLGDRLNTPYNEYGAVISADESVIVFTSRRPGSTGGKIDPSINEPFEDIYISYKQDDGTWSQAKNVGESVNSDDHDAISGIAPDGQKFFVYLGRKNNGGDLYESVLNGDEWTKPESLGKEINTKDYHESSACYSPDGKTLYFVTDKPGGIGGHDIYIAYLDEKGNWGGVKNLGPLINTPFDEEAVFLHPDGKTLYFSSKGHNSMGGFDIFKSVLDQGTGIWGKPVNIGYPVNTTDDDVFFVISGSGRHGYYTSTSTEGEGEGLRDLYMVTFLGPEKPMVLNNEDNLLASVAAPIKETVIAPIIVVQEAQLTILKGVISDYLTKDLLEAEIEIVDNEANVVIATFRSNSLTGRFLVSLPAGKNYGIAVKKDGYLFHSENFDIPSTAAFQTVEKDIELKNLAVGSKIILKNIFFDLDKATLRSESTAELNRLIQLMTDVPTLKIELGGHTDSRGSDTYNQQLSERRAQAVVDYLTAAGIAAGRLKSAGYGETQLVNECSNGVQCSDEQHQENRRTEFKVLAL